MNVSPTYYPNRAYPFDPRLEHANSPIALNVLITVTLIAACFVGLLCFGVPVELGIPLALLIGLTGQHFVRIAIVGSAEIFAPTTVIAGYFILDVALRTLYILFESPT